MINTYKRRTINQRAELHEHEFVTYDDVQEVLVKFAHIAIKAGADEDKVLDFLKGGDDEKIS
jgi:hypothetical protein